MIGSRSVTQIAATKKLSQAQVPHESVLKVVTSCVKDQCSWAAEAAIENECETLGCEFAVFVRPLKYMERENPFRYFRALVRGFNDSVSRRQPVISHRRTYSKLTDINHRLVTSFWKKTTGCSR